MICKDKTEPISKNLERRNLHSERFSKSQAHVINHLIIVVVAERMAGSKMYELVKVGYDKLVGEIIKLDGDSAYIQCYEDTCTIFITQPV